MYTHGSSSGILPHHSDAMQIIDAHIHYHADHPECIQLFKQLELKLFNVCVAQAPGDGWHAEARVYSELAAADTDRFAWCTSFDPFAFERHDHAERVIAQLGQDLADGAVGCKVWKNIGMEIRKPDGDFLMIDDPVFDPVFAFLQKHGVTVLAHMGEPRECWQPLNEASPHHSYYKAHPEWHMFGRTGFPSHAQIIAARDHLLAKFPKLRVVGAHLGSLEHEVAAIAQRFDRYPNFAVDTSARIRDLSFQRSATVRQFFEHHQDRILFGTDIVHRQRASRQSAADRRAALKHLNAHYQMEKAYFESDQPVNVDGHQVQALGLPDVVLDKFYSANALHWYPGMADSLPRRA